MMKRYLYLYTFLTLVSLISIGMLLGRVHCVTAATFISPVDPPDETDETGQVPDSVNEDDIPELPALLKVLAGPQGWVILGIFVSMVLDKIPEYEEIKSQEAKKTIFIVVVALLSTLAYVMVTYVPIVFWEATADIWVIIAGVVMTWIGGNGWHALAKKIKIL